MKLWEGDAVGWRIFAGRVVVIRLPGFRLLCQMRNSTFRPSPLPSPPSTRERE
jgi:hypothetical protein